MPDIKLIKEMFSAGCHVGHKTSKWNPKMAKFLYDKNEGIHIIDLEKTYEALMKVLEFLKAEIAKGKVILLVSTKLQAKKLIEEMSQKTGMPYVTQKWIPGLLTNYETIKKRIKYLKELRDKEAAGEFEKYTKREASDFRKTIQKLEKALGGVENMTHLPDIVFVASVFRDKNAVKESNRLHIPLIGICDSNADPGLCTYSIPCNDDSVKSLQLIIKKIEEAIVEEKPKVV